LGKFSAKSSSRQTEVSRCEIEAEGSSEMFGYITGGAIDVAGGLRI
jgi:hypothetical protein